MNKLLIMISTLLLTFSSFANADGHKVKVGMITTLSEIGRASCRERV